MLNQLLDHAHYLGIIVVLILTGSGLPIPEEVPIIWAGVASSDHVLNPWLALASCFIGALAGDCVMYAVGYHFGRSVLREHPYWARFIKPEREAQIEEMIQRHGLKVFFLARFLVGLRSPVYLTAGIMRVPFRRFLLVDASCAAVVIGVVFSLSYFYGQSIKRWIRGGQYTLTAVALIAVTALLAWWWLRRRRKRATVEPGAEEQAQSPSKVETVREA